LYDGHTTGVELAGNIQLHARWLVHGSYTGQRVALKPLPESRDTTNARAEADDPAHMFSMRSYLNLPGELQLDGFFRAVGRLRASRLPGYQELDMRIGWQATDRLELSLIGRELLHAHHPEFPGNSAQPRYFQREVALRVTFQTQ
jgi:iron complex outermembrane receptor protein